MRIVGLTRYADLAGRKVLCGNWPECCFSLCIQLVYGRLSGCCKLLTDDEFQG